MKTLTDIEIAIKLEEIKREKVLKKTALNWMFNQLWRTPQNKVTWYKIYLEAKEMEKEQIKEAIIKGEENIDIDGCYENPNLSDQYYNETYDL